MRGKDRLRRGKGRVRQPCMSPCLPLRLAYVNEGMGKRLLRECAPVGVHQRISVCRHTLRGVVRVRHPARLAGDGPILAVYSSPAVSPRLNGHGRRVMGRSPRETGHCLASCQIPTPLTCRNSGGHLCAGRPRAGFTETQKSRTLPCGEERPRRKRKKGRHTHAARGRHRSVRACPRSQCLVNRVVGGPVRRSG